MVVVVSSLVSGDPVKNSADFVEDVFSVEGVVDENTPDGCSALQPGKDPRVCGRFVRIGE